MNQKISITMFITGLIGFLSSLAEFFAAHETWQSMTGPQDVAHIIIMLVTFLMTISGALGTQMPRDTSKGYRDRINDKISDEKLNEINSKDNGSSK